MKKFKNLLYVVIPVLLMSGCGSLGTPYLFPGRGILYSHTVLPLTGHHLPVNVSQSTRAKGDMKEIQIQYVSVIWDRNALGDVASKAGIKTIYYADLEKTSILLGIWTSYTVHIYGTAAPTSPLSTIKP